MRHTTPTCQAHAQPTGKARPNKAGATRQAQGEPTAALADREAFLTEFSPAERLQLSETAKLNLDEEISLLSRTLRRFMRAAESASEDDYPANLAKSLDLLGLTCSRLASVLRVNVMLAGPQKTGLAQELLERLMDFRREVKAGGEASRD